MKTSVFSLAVLGLTLTSAAGIPSSAYAEEVKLEVDQANAMQRGLNLLIGKSVTLRLNSGGEMSGVVEAVGPTAIRLGALVGKEFYSAVVQLEDVSAVVYRAK